MIMLQTSQIPGNRVKQLCSEGPVISGAGKPIKPREIHGESHAGSVCQQRRHFGGLAGPPPPGARRAAREGWREGTGSRNNPGIRGEDIEKYMFTQILHSIRMKHTSLAIKAGLRQQSVIGKHSAAIGTDINMCRRCKSEQ